MSCEQLNKYETGRMSAEEFGLHVKGCASCRKQIIFDAQLDTELKSLKQPVHAPHLWERIEKSLEEEKKKHEIQRKGGRSLRLFRIKWFLLVPAAAMILASLGLGIYFGLKQRTPQSGILAQKTLEKIELKEGEYIQAINELEKTARPKLAGMDLQMMSLYRDRLAAIDSQLERCKEALASNPASAHIRRYLLAALQDKKQTLAEVLGYGN
jgi:hypothetical protein